MHYQIAKSIGQVCAVLKIAPERVLRRAGLPSDQLANEGKGVTAAQFFAVWEAFVDEAKRPDLAIFLGRAYAHGPFSSPLFAFSCSPNIEVGLTRLSLFKPLMGPVELRVKRAATSLDITLSSTDAVIPIPGSMAAFELVYFLECSRTFTAEHIIPLEIGIPNKQKNQTELDAYFGVKAQLAEVPTIVLSIEDAERPLVSENPGLWAGFEKDLQRQLANQTSESRMTTRVKSALLELLPSGQSSVEAVCDRLHVSKRSLQRHLKNEGQSFQTILDSTRSELSLHYLSSSDLRIEEISYLLAYRDPNSFYRAFHGWTGMTPTEARGQQSH